MLTSTLTFTLLTGLFYALLSTMHIYLVPTSSRPTSSDPNQTTPSSPPPTDRGTDFLFRLGGLHVYGIRALFMTVTVGGSISVLLALTYVGIACRKRVAWDMGEEWRSGGWWQQRATGMADTSSGDWWNCQLTQDEGTSMRSVSRLLVADHQTASVAGRRSTRRGLVPASVASSSVYSRSARSSFRPLRWGSDTAVVVKTSAIARERLSETRNAVSLLRGRALARRDLRVRRCRDVEDAERRRVVSSSVLPGPWARRSACTTDSTDTVSGYEIPSYYLNDSGGWVASARSSVAIPSYYFEEHGKDGKSIETGLGKRPKTNVIGPGGQSQSASLAGSTLVSGQGRRRGDSLSLSGTTGAVAGTRKPQPDDDRGWETVHCSGWKGADG